MRSENTRQVSRSVKYLISAAVCAVGLFALPGTAFAETAGTAATVTGTVQASPSFTALSPGVYAVTGNASGWCSTGPCTMSYTEVDDQPNHTVTGEHITISVAGGTFSGTYSGTLVFVNPTTIDAALTGQIISGTGAFAGDTGTISLDATVANATTAPLTTFHFAASLT